MHRVTFHEAGKLLGLTYETIRRRAQVGSLEPADPIDGVQAVSYRSVAVLGAQLDRSIADVPVDTEAFTELRESLTAFHLEGVRRAVFLQQLEGDALQAEHKNDLASACAYWQLVAGLATACYAYNPARGTWTVHIPGIGSSETMAAPPATVATEPVAGDAS